MLIETTTKTRSSSARSVIEDRMMNIDPAAAMERTCRPSGAFFLRRMGFYKYAAPDGAVFGPSGSVQFNRWRRRSWEIERTALQRILVGTNSTASLTSRLCVQSWANTVWQLHVRHERDSKARMSPPPKRSGTRLERVPTTRSLAMS